MTVYEIKLDFRYFDDVKSGKLNLKALKNIEDYQLDDVLLLRKWSPDSNAISEFGSYMTTKFSKQWNKFIGVFTENENEADTIRVKILKETPLGNIEEKSLKDSVSLKFEVIDYSGLTVYAGRSNMSEEWALSDELEERDNLIDYLYSRIELVEQLEGAIEKLTIPETIAESLKRQNEDAYENECFEELVWDWSYEKERDFRNKNPDILIPIPQNI